MKWRAYLDYGVRLGEHRAGVKANGALTGRRRPAPPPHTRRECGGAARMAHRNHSGGAGTIRRSPGVGRSSRRPGPGRPGPSTRGPGRPRSIGPHEPPWRSIAADARPRSPVARAARRPKGARRGAGPAHPPAGRRRRHPARPRGRVDGAIGLDDACAGRSFDTLADPRSDEPPEIVEAAEGIAALGADPSALWAACKRAGAAAGHPADRAIRGLGRPAHRLRRQGPLPGLRPPAAAPGFGLPGVLGVASAAEAAPDDRHPAGLGPGRRQGPTGPSDCRSTLPAWQRP